MELPEQWFPTGVPGAGDRGATSPYNSSIFIPIKPARGYVQVSLILSKGVENKKRLGITVLEPSIDRGKTVTSNKRILN